MSCGAEASLPVGGAEFRSCVGSQSLRPSNTPRRKIAVQGQSGKRFGKIGIEPSRSTLQFK